MALRKFVLANLYIITIAWFIGGFGWMFTLLFFPDSFYMVLPAFIVTISGNLWLWAASRYAGHLGKPRILVKEEGREVPAVAEPHGQPRPVPLPPM